MHRERWPGALAAVKWEGRMEQAAPHLIVDGAHNPGAVEAFIRNVELLEGDQTRSRQPVVVFAAASDKKYEEMARSLCEKLKAKAYICLLYTSLLGCMETIWVIISRRTGRE